MIFPYEDFDLTAFRTYPLDSRASKAKAADFAKPCGAGATFGLVSRLAAEHARRGRLQGGGRAIAAARQNDRGIVWGLGAHVIKTGLGPVIVDLMERGFVSAIATNGAAVIHDFEVALVGATSEDVDESLGPGRFGMADETGRLLNEAIVVGNTRRNGHRAGRREIAGGSPARRSRVSASSRRRRG